MLIKAWFDMTAHNSSWREAFLDVVRLWDRFIVHRCCVHPRVFAKQSRVDEDATSKTMKTRRLRPNMQTCVIASAGIVGSGSCGHHRQSRQKARIVQRSIKSHASRHPIRKQRMNRTPIVCKQLHHQHCMQRCVCLVPWLPQQGRWCVLRVCRKERRRTHAGGKRGHGSGRERSHQGEQCCRRSRPSKLHLAPWYVCVLVSDLVRTEN